ncbi:MAG: FkbM family methyltransferase [Candidatus Nanoarchaeia archaeon]|nr:FkbM family methyltransferase [Candidatus Nanoarchaeia archaeon]
MKFAEKISRIINNYESFIDYFLIRKSFIKNKIIRLKNGLVLKVRNKTDLEIINEIIIDKEYYDKIGKKKSIILDVGAQIGVFSNYISKKYPNSTVYSFEPMKDNFKLLKENIELNNNKNVVAINKALFNYSGECYINIDDNNSGGHSLIIKSKKREKIKTISFDDFIKENKIKKIELLKLDCEGSEYGILFKSKKDNIKKIKTITMEYHDIDNGKSFNELKKFLKNNDFEIKKMKKNEQTGLITAIRRG